MSIKKNKCSFEYGNQGEASVEEKRGRSRRKNQRAARAEKETGKYRRLLPVSVLLLFLILLTVMAAAGKQYFSAGIKGTEMQTSGYETPGIQEPEMRTSETQIPGTQSAGGLNAETEAAGSTLPAADTGETAAETEEAAAGTAQLLFAGDVYLSDHVLEAYDAAGDISGILSAGYRNEIAAADFFMVNEEFPFSSRGRAAEDKQYTFRIPTDRVHILKEINPSMVTLANNHALDFGQEALEDTMEVLKAAGIGYTGAGEDLAAAGTPTETDIRGHRIAVIGASRVLPAADWAAGGRHAGLFSAYDPAALLSLIKKEKEKGCFTIVYMHWGTERAEKPNEVQTALGRQLIDAGADLVTGAHPHVLQGIEYYKGKPIVYSLGNFIFGSSIPGTALLSVSLGEDNAPVLRLIPGKSAAGYTEELQGSGQRSDFYRYMESISENISIAEDGTISVRSRKIPQS